MLYFYFTDLKSHPHLTADNELRLRLCGKCDAKTPTAVETKKKHLHITRENECAALSLFRRVLSLHLIPNMPPK